MRYESCTPLLSFAAAFALIAWLARSRWARFALDHPNRRSLHDVPVPRSGGLGILLGIAIAFMSVGADVSTLLWPGLVLLGVVSFIDDLRGVNVGIRFLTQLVAAGTLAAGAVYPAFGFIAAVVCVLGTTWMANLYNFMDGSDGLAGGMALWTYRRRSEVARAPQTFMKFAPANGGASLRPERSGRWQLAQLVM